MGLWRDFVVLLWGDVFGTLVGSLLKGCCGVPPGRILGLFVGEYFGSPFGLFERDIVEGF